MLLPGDCEATMLRRREHQAMVRLLQAMFGFRHYNAAKNKKDAGKFGTAIFSKFSPLRVRDGIFSPMNDPEGRSILAECDRGIRTIKQLCAYARIAAREPGKTPRVSGLRSEDDAAMESKRIHQEQTVILVR